jgi:hypothetical protein
VVVTDLMWETMVSSFNSQLVGAIVELSTIVKIRKYKRFHERHHFIPMAMDVHGTPWRNMDHFIRECACLFQSRRSGDIYLCLFTFNFSSNMLILLFSVL